jgi:TonB-linked SusC/RagA family outer membrane protein
MKKVYQSFMKASVFLVFLGFSVAALAQDRNVSGTVKDETGNAMPGVNVIIKGTTSGTATDGDGKYTISVSDNATLVFTFVGYATSEVPVGTQTVVDVSMTPDATSLSEIVVTGYQVQRKADISGAVAVIKSSDLENLVASSFAQKLAGRAAGVTVSTSGSPGDATNVRIRGISSFGNNDPLYVIDGVQLADKGNLNLNPNDIESMQILKDPSTTSIYGTRGGNGVVVITTKKGKAGKPKLTYNGSHSWANEVKGWDDILITNSADYLGMTQQFFTNGGQAVPAYAAGGNLPTYIYAAPAFIDGTNTVGNTIIGGEATYDRYNNPIMRASQGTNWWDEITRTGNVQDHSISLSGGTDAATFSIGAGALLQEGVLKFNEFKRYNIRANSSYKVGNKIRVGQTLNYANRSIVNSPAQSEQGVLSQVYKIAPIIPVYDIGTSVDVDGYRDSFGGSKTANTGNANNPYAALFRGRKNIGITNNIMGNLYGELDIINGLTYRTDFKYNVDNFNNKNFSYRSPENQENQGAQNFNENWNTSFNWIWTNSLSYSKTLADKHTINVFAGYESQKGRFRNIFGSVNNYFTTDPNVWYLNTAFGDASTRQVNSGGNENRLLSVFGKLDYSLSGKYYVSATVRRDGSSRFSEGNKYGVFPAVSLAWRVTGESFLANNSFLNDFKLRASWGVAGNDRIADYNFADRWGGSVGSAFYAIDGANGASTTGYHLTNLGTTSLGQETSWEESTTTNVGFDASLLGDKLTAVLDVYTRTTEQLLYNPPLPGTLGYPGANPPSRNTASMKNNGFDLALGYKGQISSDLKFNVDLNLSRYKTEITEVDGTLDFFYPNAAQGRIDNRLPMEININRIGYPISSFNGYEVEGIIQSAAETTGQPGSQIGGLKFRDLNGDGQITNAGDLTIIGNPHPDFTYGLNLGLTYKDFNLTAFFVGSQGNEIFNYTRLFTHFRQFFSNVSQDY